VVETVSEVGEKSFEVSEKAPEVVEKISYLQCFQRWDSYNLSV